MSSKFKTDGKTLYYDEYEECNCTIETTINNGEYRLSYIDDEIDDEIVELDYLEDYLIEVQVKKVNVSSSKLQVRESSIEENLDKPERVYLNQTNSFAKAVNAVIPDLPKGQIRRALLLGLIN